MRLIVPLKSINKEKYYASRAYAKELALLGAGVYLFDGYVKFNAITIDDEFVIHDIKVIEGEKGLFIAMPSKKATDGEYKDIAHPINSSTRERIQNTMRTQRMLRIRRHVLCNFLTMR